MHNTCTVYFFGKESSNALILDRVIVRPFLHSKFRLWTKSYSLCYHKPLWFNFCIVPFIVDFNTACHCLNWKGFLVNLVLVCFSGLNKLSSFESPASFEPCLFDDSVKKKINVWFPLSGVNENSKWTCTCPNGSRTGHKRKLWGNIIYMYLKVFIHVIIEPWF